MTAASHENMARGTTPAQLGKKHIRWGFGLFIFGLVVGFIPLAHYMHGSFEPVEAAFLQKVTLWWGCAFTLAIYVTQVGGLAMIAIGLCYVVFARDGAMTSDDGRDALRPSMRGGDHRGVCGRSCRLLRRRRGLAELLLQPITAGKVAWLALQAVCIAVYVIGVIWAYSGIKHAVAVITPWRQDDVDAMALPRTL